MAATDAFRKQHEELLVIAGRLTKLLDPVRLAADAASARIQLSDLAGKLKVHLAMEDKGLYPRMIGDTDSSVRDVAKRFVDEMGGIATVFTEYMDRWRSTGAIQQSPQQFVKETRDLVGALASRIDRENTQLYPLLDRRG